VGIGSILMTRYPPTWRSGILDQHMGNYHFENLRLRREP
jgi:hypothetical protein